MTRQAGSIPLKTTVEQDTRPMKPMRQRETRMRRLRLMSVLLTTGVLASCSDFFHMPNEQALIETTPRLGHPIAFVERNEYLDVELPPRNRHLSRSQWVDVYRFGIRYRTESTGALVVSPPGKRRSAERWHSAVGDVQNALKAAGIGAERIEIGAPSRGRYVTLSFNRPVAVAPGCGHWQEDAGRNRERVPYRNFGCATQRNLAGMVVNSRDLIGSQEEVPAAGERRSPVWSKYVTGDAAQNNKEGGDSSTQAKPTAAKK